MNIPLILPERALQRFFSIKLRQDLALDLEAIKAELPGVYWQLPPSYRNDPIESRYLSATSNSCQLIQQRLWMGENQFSQVILLLTDMAIEILYIQLLPSSSSLVDVKDERYHKKSLKKYTFCIRKTIKNLIAFARQHQAKQINTILFNAELAKLFIQIGFSPRQPKGNHLIASAMDKFELVLNIFTD